MSLDTNQQIAHDNVVSVMNALNQLLLAMHNAISPLTTAGATDSLAKIQALEDAMAPFQQAVINCGQTYTEAGNI